MSGIEPQPGEVWVITEEKYGPESWDSIHDYGPFIVTYISKLKIGFVAVQDGTEPLAHHYQRGQWDWEKHAIRIWPPSPSWAELSPAARAAQALERRPDDLRSARREGVA